MKEIKDDTKRWRDTSSSWMRRVNIVKMTEVHKAIHRFNPWIRKIPWRRKWQPTPVFLSGKDHGQRSLAGYSPWGGKELDMTQQLDDDNNNTQYPAWKNTVKFTVWNIQTQVTRQAEKQENMAHGQEKNYSTEADWVQGFMAP